MRLLTNTKLLLSSLESVANISCGSCVCQQAACIYGLCAVGSPMRYEKNVHCWIIISKMFYTECSLVLKPVALSKYGGQFERFLTWTRIYGLVSLCFKIHDDMFCWNTKQKSCVRHSSSASKEDHNVYAQYLQGTCRNFLRHHQDWRWQAYIQQSHLDRVYMQYFEHLGFTVVWALRRDVLLLFKVYSLGREVSMKEWIIPQRYEVII